MSIRSGFFFPVFLFISFSCWAQTAAVRGNVFDSVSRDGLMGTYVSLNSVSGDRSVKKIADDKGNFEIAGLPAGEYELQIEHVGFSSYHRHLVLIAGQTLRIYAGLTAAEKALNEVTVLGEYRDKEAAARSREKNAPNIVNIISSQAMTRSPDINAANVLQRMSGITVQHSSGGDEAYAVIRGMEPRYNNTLVNGIKIASPDSKNRFVQLDIIPSDILSSIEISKSLTPDMEGDAIGGTVNMVVKDAPDHASFKATGSIGYSQLFFDEKYIDFKKGDIQDKSPIQRNPLGYVTQPSDFSRSNLDFQPRQAPPSGTLGFSYTQRYLHNKLGLVLADNVQDQFYGNVSSRFTVSPGGYSGDSLLATDVTNYKGYTQQLNNGLVAHLDYVFNSRNRIGVDNFYIYSYLAQARISYDTTLVGTGRIGPGTGQVFVNSQSLTQHQYVENLKVSGRHELFPGFVADWAGVWSQAARREPDLANIETDFLIKSNFTQTGNFFDQITRQWLKNNDKDYDGILNLSYKTRLHKNDLLIKAGELYRTKTRYNNEDDYILHPLLDTTTGIKPLWTNIYAAQYFVSNPSGTNVYNPNNYKANEITYAEYLMAIYSTRWWDGGGGLRVENTNTNWNINVHSSTQPNAGQQVYQDFLPSAFVKFKFNPKEALRLSYFRSIARPNYYELVPTSTFATDYYIVGNPNLIHSVADNYDIRYERFFKGEENLFLGAFYKTIQDPIEQQLQSVAAGKLYLLPMNSGTARNYGAELSFTKYLGKFGLTGNYTYTHSAVSSTKETYLGKSIQETRPLQGQTANIANVSLLYKDVKHGFFAQLAYEYQGKTLAQTSIYYKSDYYQLALNTLAFSLEKDIQKHFTLFGKFNNLLNTTAKEYVYAQNPILVAQDMYKATYMVGLRYAH